MSHVRRNPIEVEHELRMSLDRETVSARRYVEAEGQIAQLRAALATVTAERDDARADVLTFTSRALLAETAFATERAAHRITKVDLERTIAAYAECWATLESTRSSLAAVEAQVRELERKFAAYLLCSQRLAEGFNEPLVSAPDEVQRLCREHDGKPIGACSRCSKLAPLIHSGGFSCGDARECAWGCSDA